jgi:hypothetical protein
MYKIPKANAVAMPVDPNAALSKGDPGKEEKEGYDERLSGGYANAIRALMYVAIGARPDISSAVQTLRKFTKDPGPTHWSALKRVFQYLAGTRGMALTYGALPEDSEVLSTGYPDAGFAADIDN